MLQSLGNDLKKILLAGIGAAAVTAEKSQQVVAELVRRGELTVEQGRSINEELQHKAQQRRQEEWLEQVERLSPQQRQALKDKLEDKLEELERQDSAPDAEKQ